MERNFSSIHLDRNGTTSINDTDVGITSADKSDEIARAASLFTTNSAYSTNRDRREIEKNQIEDELFDAVVGFGGLRVLNELSKGDVEVARAVGKYGSRRTLKKEATGRAHRRSKRNSWMARHERASMKTVREL